MCVHTYVCMYVYVCMCVSVCVFMYVRMYVCMYHVARKFDGEFNFDGLTFFALTVKLISVNVNFPYTMCLLTEHFVKFKICHIFIMLFRGYFIKFYSRQIFRPYGMNVCVCVYSKCFW